MPETTAITCPNNATCPFIADAGDGHYLVIGTTTTPERAAEHGGGVAEHETAVLVPKPVVDALSQPTRDRIAELEADLDVAVLLINDLTDPDDCWFDHHGGCQAHGALSLEPGEKCPHAEAKELLARHGSVAEGGVDD